MNKKEMLEAPLDQKIKQTKRLIMDWYYQFDGKVYISFSGGKDSTVLLHIARQLFPDIPAVFANTGLEFPEIVDFVKTIDNVKIVKPLFNGKPISFKQVIDNFGYPIIGKEQASYIEKYRASKSEKYKDRLWNGMIDKNGRTKMFKISEKWKYIVEKHPDLKVTSKCCDIMKKNPFKRYEKETGRKPIIGIMAGESSLRKQQFLRDECNSFKGKRPISRPIIFWDDNDIWKYLRDFNVDYSPIYNMGYKRTGCVFCLYGMHLEKNDRFEQLKKTHPKLFDYCMNKLGIRKVLKIYLNKEYNQQDLFK